ncbi:hypothetical protein [Gemmatimonas sp.]
MTALGTPRSLFDAAPLPPSVALLRVVAVKTHDQSRIRARITLCTEAGAVVETITLRVGCTGWTLLTLPALREFAQRRGLTFAALEACSFTEADALAATPLLEP